MPPGDHLIIRIAPNNNPGGALRRISARPANLASFDRTGFAVRPRCTVRLRLIFFYYYCAKIYIRCIPAGNKTLRLPFLSDETD